MPIALVLVLFIGGGVSYAAESSLPGDILYPVKINMNESVGGVLAVSAEADVAWQTRLIERRLNEAEELAVRGRLDTETREQIESNFSRHAERVKIRIAAFEEKKDFDGAADASSNFEISLRVHERILSRLADNEEETPNEVLPLAKKIKKETSRAIRSREDAEANISLKANAEVQNAAEGKRNAAENKIATTKRSIDAKKVTLGATATADAELRLKTAEETFAEGEVKLSAKAYADAFILFQKTIRIAEEARRLVEARGTLDLDIYLNGRERPNIKDDDEKDTNGEKQEDNDTEDNSSEIEIESESETNVDAGKGSIRETGAIKLRFGF
ncbi:MAG: DUF5667 domain-containing protein [bacterium]|nr:DUF5667 domain-containing protein [bacterium]